MAVPATRVMDGNISSNYISFLVPTILIIILIHKNNITFKNKRIIIPTLLISLWSLSIFVKYSNTQFYASFYIILIYNLICAYVIVQSYRWKLFYLIEKVVTQLSFIGLFFWIASNINYNFVYNLMIFKTNEIISGSNLIYSLTSLNDKGGILLRNSGFSWEPGRYACFIIIAIYINLIRNKMNFRQNNNLYILLVSLISTQSTTGYVTGIIIYILLYIYNTKRKNLISIVLFIGLVISISSLPFMGEKIKSLWIKSIDKKEIIGNFDYMEYDEKFNNRRLVPQRFEGLYLEALNIENDPILGYGRDASNSFLARYNIYPSNGILSVFSIFGIIGFLFYYGLIKSSSTLTKTLKYKGKIILFILYISISISYNFSTIPIFLSIWLYALFTNKERCKKLNIKGTRNFTPIKNKWTKSEN